MIRFFRRTRLLYARLMSKKNIAILSLFVLAITVCLIPYLKRDVIYLHFEDIPKYPYTFVGQDEMSPKKVVLKQTGKFWYMWWEFELDSSEFKRVELDKLKNIDVVSQYWIINNMNGFALNFDFRKLDSYNLKIIRFEEDSVSIYPVKDVRCLIE